jgi:hypothetical protein
MRRGDFPSATKRSAIRRQGGLCAWCGVRLQTPWSTGEFPGCAHHLRPLKHGGGPELDNCVYLCWGDHLLMGHGMAPFGIDSQGGGSNAWVQIAPSDFEFWSVALT